MNLFAHLTRRKSVEQFPPDALRDTDCKRTMGVWQLTAISAGDLEGGL